MTPGILTILMGSMIDPDAQSWRARVLANGGSASPATVRAVSNFAKATKAAGIWTKLNRINLFAGDQLAAALVPLKVGAGGLTDTNTNFVSGDYTQAAGLTGNGTSKRLDTGALANAYSSSSRHLMVYERVRSSSIFGTSIGSEQGAGVQRWGIQCTSPTTTIVYQSDATATSASKTSAPSGMMVGNNQSSITSDLYINGALAGTVGVAAPTPPALSQWVFALNRGGAAADISTATLAGYSIGTALTAGEIAAYYTAMQAFQTALGRQV